MTRRRDGHAAHRTVIGAMVAVGLAAGCGALADTTTSRDDPPVTTAAPPTIDPNATLDELLPELLTRWRGLDQRVIDEEATEPLARIEEVWALAEPLIRAEHEGSLFGFQQAIDLARSAVTRTRPADASKGYRLALELTDDLLDR